MQFLSPSTSFSLPFTSPLVYLQFVLFSISRLYPSISLLCHMTEFIVLYDRFSLYLSFFMFVSVEMILVSFSRLTKFSLCYTSSVGLVPITAEPYDCLSQWLVPFLCCPSM